jgi:hypothetical protein
MRRNLCSGTGTGICRPPVSPSAFQRALSPAVRKFLTISDRHQLLWDSFWNYLRPLNDAITSEISADAPPPEINESVAILKRIAWIAYTTYLACSLRGSTLADPNAVLDCINHIRRAHRTQFDSDDLIRLATLEAVFRSTVQEFTVAGLRCLPGSAIPLSERLAEIRDDADLQEVAILRGFFSARTNIARLRRDLRLLVKTIRNKKWARGLVQTTSHYLKLGPAVETAAPFFEGLGAKSARGTPLLIGDPYEFLYQNCEGFWFSTPESLLWVPPRNSSGVLYYSPKVPNRH